MAADTSSAAAGNIPVVEAAAVALASPIAEPILAKSVAAEATTSGTVNTKDIQNLHWYRTAGEAPLPALVGRWPVRLSGSGVARRS
jgi:hypothetical protein